MDYRQIKAIEEARKKQIKKVCPEADDSSGIYVFWRDDPSGIRFCYVGQAKHLLKRMSDHMKGYPQHIDSSIKKRKLYDEKANEYGYHVEIICKCLESELDKLETQYIKEYSAKGFQLLNVSGGGQGANRIGEINERKPAKGYRDGLAKGYQNAQKEVKKLFEKNLTYSINGKSTKLKERAYEKFTEFLQENSEKDSENS